MTARDIITKIRKRLNKDDTDDFDNVSLFSAIEAYNKAQLNVINYFTKPLNQEQVGAEGTFRNIDRLSFLLNKTPRPLNMTKEGRYWFSEKFPTDYYKYRQSYSEATNGKCDKKVILHIPYEEANIELIMRNSNQNASFEWGEAPITVAESRLKIHTDNKFDVLKAYLTYYRYPRPIDIAGYIKADGTASTDVDSEFTDDMTELCIDEAVRILQGDIQNIAGVQISQQNLLRGE